MDKSLEFKRLDVQSVLYLRNFTQNSDYDERNCKQFLWYNSLQWMQMYTLVLFLNEKATVNYAQQHIGAIGQNESNRSKETCQLIR